MMKTPFVPGVCGCDNFRIPALYTLDDGSILAAADARWNHIGDGAKLDTLTARSKDRGKTWQYRFANRFQDSEDAFSLYGATFIDPALVQGKDGTVYLLADLWPGGTALNTVPHRPAPGCTGYLDADGDGELELVLYEKGGLAEDQVTEEYDYYADEFGEDGFSPVWPRGGGGGAKPVYYLDRWYYLYDADRRPVPCPRLCRSELGRSPESQPARTDGRMVHANVFFYYAPIHVRATSYLWLVTSADRGLTWSAPMILNPQVRTKEEKNIWFYGAGPGRGLTTSSGRVMFPCYTQAYGVGDGHTSVIYTDDGRTWKKSGEVPLQSSEAVLLELNGKIYLFARHGIVCVSDDMGETWKLAKGWPEGLYKDCQISAIACSKPMDGRQVILLSGPSGLRENTALEHTALEHTSPEEKTTAQKAAVLVTAAAEAGAEEKRAVPASWPRGRFNGKLWVGVVEEASDETDVDSVTWLHSFDVSENNTIYAYSCLTELPDGDVGLLYESGEGEMIYLDIQRSL